jgi:hypothetical protein
MPRDFFSLDFLFLCSLFAIAILLLPYVWRNHQEQRRNRFLTEEERNALNGYKGPDKEV